MKCNSCGCTDDGFQLVNEELGLHLCPDCGSADVDTGAT